MRTTVSLGLRGSFRHRSAAGSEAPAAAPPPTPASTPPASSSRPVQTTHWFPLTHLSCRGGAGSRRQDRREGS
jgi:hypothetical protein